MGEVHVQYSDHSPTPTTVTMPQKQKQSIIPNTTSSMYDHQEQQQQQQHNDHSVLEPTDLFSMMQLNNPSHHRHTPCNTVNNSMKRRSPPSSSSSGQPSAKKLFCDQEDLLLHGFSAIPIPLNLSALVNKTPSFPVLRRCVSDPYTPPPPPLPRGSGLPPLPPTLRRSVSDLSPSSDKAFSRSSAPEETATAPEFMRLRRMKDRLKEMRQWWDEVIREEEEEEECAARDNDKVLSQDELGGGDCEEAVNVEWAEKCLSLAFRCPCGKGYEVLLSENNCYYKLV